MHLIISSSCDMPWNEKSDVAWVCQVSGCAGIVVRKQSIIFQVILEHAEYAGSTTVIIMVTTYNFQRIVTETPSSFAVRCRQIASISI